MKERRAQNRLLDAELVMVSWEERSRTLKQLGNVEDVSSDGIGILVDHPLAPGTLVTISYDPGDLKGIVRRQNVRNDLYFLGVEFVGDSKDSTLHFQPELLVR